MSSILNCVYSYVFKLDLIISKCVCNQFELSDEFKRFCGKTILTSNINVDINYNNILVSSKPCTDSLTHIKHQYIQQFYSKTGKYKDMIPKEDAIDYLNNHVFNELHALLGGEIVDRPTFSWTNPIAIFWAIINFIGFFFRTLVPIGNSGTGNNRFNNDDRRGPRGPRFRSGFGSSSAPNAPPCVGGG